MLGHANVAASAFVLMLISFVFGAAAGAALVAFWHRKRARGNIVLPTTDQQRDYGTPGAPVRLQIGRPLFPKLYIS